jgi:SAM-dependent methyltransferase
MASSFELHRERRGLFSSDVAAYESGRPPYPERVYELLGQVCGLGPGSEVVEIGPGTGQATGSLLDRGASVTAVELGPELAGRLEAKYAGRHLSVKVAAFEDVRLDPESFDLIVAATSFHWIPTERGLHRCAELLRPGGWLALWWSYFGDPDRPDPFHPALTAILERLAPSILATTPGIAEAGHHPYSLDATARIAEIAATGRFGSVHHETIAWTGRHSPSELRAMFASFSPWLAVPPTERDVLLDAVERLALDTFHGVVERPYLTPVYLAPRA